MSKLKYCGIVECPNNRGIRDADTPVFSPRNPEIVNKWRDALKNLGLETSSYRPVVCKLHFDPNDIIPGKNSLQPGAMPSIRNLPLVDDVSPTDQDDKNIIYPVEMVELISVPDDIDMGTSIQKDNKLCETVNDTDCHASDDETNDHCTECTKNHMKIKLLERNNENMRKKCKNLMKELIELRKSQNQTTFDDDQLADETDDSEEWCEVCWKISHDIDRHICIDNHKIIRCEYCSAKFSSTTEFRRHLNEVNHPNTKIYKCEMCTLEYPSALLLMFHQISELDHAKSKDIAADQTIKCYICDANFNSMPDLQQHLRGHLIDNRCKICNEVLTFHEIGEHLCDEQETVRCEYCSESFDATVKLIEHLNSRHDDLILHRCRKCNRHDFPMSYLRDLHEKCHPKEKPKPWWCGECSKGFTTEWSLFYHKRLHSNERNFMCEQCGKSFKIEIALRRHRYIHRENTIQCSDCPAKFKTQLQLRLHRQVHQNIRYKCNECSVTYSMKSALFKHTRIVHKGAERKFACTLCTLSFHGGRDLESHMRSHTKEKPFKCTHCDRKYSYKGDLNKHKRIHVGDNIYKCELCDKGFRLPMEFRRHTFEHYKKDKEKFSKNPEPNTNNAV